MTLTLRWFAEAPDLGAAEAVLAGMTAALGPFRPTSLQAPERYWKMPELFEFQVRLAPTGSDEEAFAALTRLGGAAWHLDDQEDPQEGIWNHAPGRELLLPEVRWAQLERQTPASLARSSSRV